jgi:hypothetical protein
MSEQQLAEYLKRLTPLLGYLPRETLEEMLALVREAKKKAGGGIPASATEEMVKAVDDKLMRDIVNDLRKGPGVPGWLPPREPVQVPPKGSGLAGGPKPEDPTKKYEMFDQMVAGLVGGPNDTSKLR